MKIKIEKILKEGKYFVYVEVSDFNSEDIEKMQKFGVPNIDLSPRTAVYKNRIVHFLPLNEFKQLFIFNNSLTANIFATTIKNKIGIAIRKLRSLKDDFSKSGEYDV